MTTQNIRKLDEVVGDLVIAERLEDRTRRWEEPVDASVTRYATKCLRCGGVKTMIESGLARTESDGLRGCVICRRHPASMTAEVYEDARYHLARVEGSGSSHLTLPDEPGRTVCREPVATWASGVDRRYELILDEKSNGCKFCQVVAGQIARFKELRAEIEALKVEANLTFYKRHKRRLDKQEAWGSEVMGRVPHYE